MLTSSCDWNCVPSERGGGMGEEGEAEVGERERKRVSNFPNSHLSLFLSSNFLLLFGLWKKFLCPYENFLPLTSLNGLLFLVPKMSQLPQIMGLYPSIMIEHTSIQDLDTSLTRVLSVSLHP